MTVRPEARRARVLVGQAVVKLALFVVYAAIVSVLLPLRVASLAPHDKIAALATISSIALVLTAIAQPAIGALSDRTVGRRGRRLPWMIGGAVLGGLALGVLGGVSSVVLLGVLWAIAQPALKGLEVATDAYLVDAFPTARRGLAAGVVGLALVAGSAIGAITAATLSTRPALATWLLCGGVLLAVLVFALLVRDRPTVRAPRDRRRFLDSIRAAGAALRAHPDYGKVLLWQLGFGIAYGVVFAYLLYVVTDLVGLPKVAAAHLVGVATVLGAIAAALSVALGGWLSDRLARRRVFMILGNVLIVLGDALLLAMPTGPDVLAAATLFGVGLGLSISCGRALASQVLPDPENGAGGGLGLLNTATSLGQAAAPLVGALVISIGGYPATFVASIVAAIACSIAIALVKTVR